MIVDCHSCGATYNISDDKVRGRRVRVRCKTCGEGIIVDGAALDDATRVYSPNFEPDATRVYAPTFEPAAYSEDRDESTRVMSASGAEWREPGPEDWTVNLSETEQRTMSLRDLVSGYNTGEVGDDAFVWRDGMTDWLPLRGVPEIKAALDSGESTRVMSQAALRAAAAGSPPSVPSSPPPLTPPPPPPPPPPASAAVRAAPRAAAARAVMPPTPVTYAAPVAPPRALRAEPPPAASVEYAPAPAWPAAPARGAAPARVRENRARTDLFGGGPDANSEDELLRSSSVPLEQYDEKPTGARNESSVLFSLDTLKAGARRGSSTSAPPRMVAASPPTAADILGMTAGGALSGMDSTAMLLSAPRVEAPAPPPVAAAPVRDRDTTPPTMRNKTPLALIAAILALAAAVAGAAFFVLRSHAGSSATAGSATAEPTVAPSALAAAAPPASAAAPAPTTQVATAAAEPPQAPAPVLEAPAAAAPAAPAPVAPSQPKAAAPSGGGSSLEAMKAAMRPAGADKPADKPADKGTKGGKLVLEEEPSGGSAPPAGGEAAEPPAEEAPKPPFDTGAAKAALANAAAGAAGCKKADGPTGSGKVQVTFSPSGRATSANVIEGAFGGTPVGGCVAKLFRAAKVPAFSGDPVTVSKSFSVPE